MTNQDSEVLSRDLLRNLAKKWWIIVLCAIIGGVVSLKWRKTLPTGQRIQATVISPVDLEIFNFLIESSNGLQMAVTQAGNTLMKVAVESDADVEAKFKQWVADANKTLADIYADEIQVMTEKEKVMSQMRADLCDGTGKKTPEVLHNCVMVDDKLYYARLDKVKKIRSLRVVDVKPFILQQASIPKRDLFFGFFIGGFVGLMALSAYLQLQLFKNKK